MPAQPPPVNTPIGATGGKPITAGRTKPGPASAQTQHDYIAHMIEADKAYHAAKQPAAPVRGSSGGLGSMLARGTPPVGVGGRAREGTIMGNVDKMSR